LTELLHCDTLRLFCEIGSLAELYVLNSQADGSKSVCSLVDISMVLDDGVKWLSSETVDDSTMPSALCAGSAKIVLAAGRAS